MKEHSSRSVTDRRVIVTAGASGIGRAIAMAFAAEGAHVCVADVAAPHLQALRAAEPRIDAVSCDIADPLQVSKLFEHAAERWDGRLDVLINNAGIAGPVAEIEHIDLADWQRTLDVNVTGMFLCVQAAIPLWRKNGHGAVINISSSSARTGLPKRLPYVVSKVAVHGLTLNVARELGPIGVSCNALLPGAVNNERGRKLTADYAAAHGLTYEQARQVNLGYISMRSEIDPAEIAAMCLHLASPAGAHISGQLIGVCGNAEWE